MIIIGIDALDYYLVKKFKLKNLMQEEYGKVDISNFKRAITPPIWASFITGKMPSEHHVTYMYRFKFGILDDIRDKLYSISTSTKHAKYMMDGEHKLFFKTIRLIRRMSLKLGLVKMYDKKYLNKHGAKTIFDGRQSCAISLPSYNESEINMTIRGHLDKVFTNFNYLNEHKEMVWDKYLLDSKKFFKEVHKKYDIIFWWIGIADELGHIYRGNEEKMLAIYKTLDNLVGRIRKNFGDEIIFVVSDHGMEKLGKYGDHLKCKYAFYSCNRKLNLKNPKITSFYNIINKILGETKNDEEIMRKRLREMGYI